MIVVLSPIMQVMDQNMIKVALQKRYLKILASAADISKELKKEKCGSRTYPKVLE